LSGIWTVSNVNPRVLVAGESDEAQLAGPARLQERGVGALLVEDAVRVVEAKDLVVLHQIDAVGPEAAKRLVELPGRLRLRSAVDLGHQEDAVPVAVAQRLAHPELAPALVVVPGVVHEGDAAIDGGADDAEAQWLVDMGQGQVPAAQTDGGHLFTGAAEDACGHEGHSVILPRGG
jgi:hypothetical protein